ncbi:UBX domain-containing protein 10 [Esox lucius]|uniref:UBX domain-containing protein n=1 Tax=Esox lucius TaxID=8010 RepID=A0AAY5K533_ESOLU|nr:UBX domain-containing protein 10 [Esox lucius]
MHLTRPKSSKGRSRPSVSQNPNVDASVHNTLPKPPSVGSGKLNRYTHSQSALRNSNELRVDEVPDYLDNVPEVSSFPFPWNKYKPLPSIEKKTSEAGISLRCMEVKTSKLSLSDNLINQAQRGHRDHQLTSVRTRAASQSNPEIGNMSEVLCEGFPSPNHLDRSVIATTQIPPLPAPGTTNPISLLLAIRAPCGRRFEHHFLSTDTLLNVLASAEAKYGTRYEHGYIETLDGYIATGVDRPLRKTFTDLNMTLAQCGIFNRSVLCIFQDIT